MRREGYQLLHEGLIELAQVERNGIRVDVERLQQTKEDLGNKIRTLRHELEHDPVWSGWRRRFGEKAKLTSRDQQAKVVHEDLGFEIKKRTASGRAAMDEEALQGIDHPFVKKLLRLSKYEKALGTFLKGIEQEVVGDRLHPSFSLHTARSLRSSSDSPNFQNFPVRDKEIAKIIRSLFIASPKSVLVENDFRGIEVALSAAYHKDPVFIDYITTPGKDMHRDMAAQIYMLEPEQVDKLVRYAAKNMFVFPQFYGDFYVSCARALWNGIERLKLKGPDGKSLYKHLKSQGIRELGALDPEEEPREGSFEAHLKEVEYDFWNRRFKVYGRWKRDWYKDYLEQGYFEMLTGFRIEGFFSRNQVVNLPVQGAAFHCLLWSLIKVNQCLRYKGMKSKVVGQIHDSLIGDVRVDELRQYLGIVEMVTTRWLPRHWEWLVVPPQIEYEIAPPGKSWFEKRECNFKQGKFKHPEKDLWTKDPVKFLTAMSRKSE